MLRGPEKHSEVAAHHKASEKRIDRDTLSDEIRKRDKERQRKEKGAKKSERARSALTNPIW